MMSKVLRVVWWLTFLFFSGVNGQSFEVPDALVEVYTPRGFRVSIPDQEGITLFAFHGKINEEMNGREGGTFSRDINKAKDGRWTFYDSQAKLEVGDILYYWTYVDYFDGVRKLGYPKDDQYFVVTELLPKPGPQPPTSTTRHPTPVTRPPTTTSRRTTRVTTTTQRTPTRDPDESCQRSVTTIRGLSSCRGQLIFDSNFRSFAKNRGSRWNVERKFASGPDYEFVLYDHNDKIMKIQNDRLVVMPILTDSIYGEGFTQYESLDLGSSCTGTERSECYQKAEGWYVLPPVTSAQLTTKGIFSFKYGKVVIRAKLPKGNWMYPELFLNPESEIYGQHKNYESGQIRIAFASGNDEDSYILEGGVILGQNAEGRKYGMSRIEKNQPWADEFHNYTVLWTPESITLSVDKTIYATVLPPEDGFSSLASNLQLKNNRWSRGNKLAPFDQEMYIVLGVGAGGHNFEDRTDGSKPWFNSQPISQKSFYKARDTWYPTWHPSSARLQVEFVKVWALEV